jgi:signal transduction histidine kinase
MPTMESSMPWREEFAVARRRSIAAWTVAALSIASIIASLVVKAAFGQVLGAEDTALIVPGLLGGVAFAVVGALIASRSGNAVGWVFLAIAASFSVSLPAQNWVDAAIAEGRYLPFTGVANWLSQWAFFLSLGLLAAVFYLFPTGSLPSPGWRLPWRVYEASLATIVVGFAVLPYRWDGIEGVIVTNPAGIEALEPVLGVVLAVAGFGLVVTSFVGLASLIVRARGADAELRQQIRWLGAVGRAGGVLFLLLLVAGFTSGNRESGFAAVAADALMVLLVITIVVGVPVTTAVAIFRFRLYDLDLVIKKTVVFAVVVALFLAMGAVVAVLVATGIVPSLADSPTMLVALGLVFGLLALPLYRVATRLADRIVFGGRATPYEVLTQFSERVGETFADEDVLPRMAAVLGAGTGAASATVWLLLGGDLDPATTWPAGAETPVRAPADAVEVLHHGEPLGALSVTMPASDPMNPSKARLVRDLAAQAGPVLANVRLIEELRASRQRLVAAQDEERRRLERNIHDGVQQQLVALNVQLGLLAKMTSGDPDRAASVASTLQEQATATLDDLRDLARGIYPPLLADQGLRTALEAQARKAALPTTVRGDGIARYPQDVEAAVYFTVLEALNNVAKYAGATEATVTLREDGGRLAFAVTDDGDGFDQASVSHGTGLQGMADRLDAVRGGLRIESTPGAGTTVSGWVPIAGSAL